MESEGTIYELARQKNKIKQKQNPHTQHKKTHPQTNKPTKKPTQVSSQLDKLPDLAKPMTK